MGLVEYSKLRRFYVTLSKFKIIFMGTTYLRPTVAKDPTKKRIEVHVSPELKAALVALAKADKRSLLNYIETLLDKHVKEKTNRG